MIMSLNCNLNLPTIYFIFNLFFSYNNLFCNQQNNSDHHKKVLFNPATNQNCDPSDKSNFELRNRTTLLLMTNNFEPGNKHL